MLRVFVLAAVCVVAANGGFGALAYQLGLPGYGDHLAALVIAWLITPFLADEY